jgi:uncharacterized protein (TIGR03492 family)
MEILCLSNGHGEDVIAVSILQQLQRHPKAPKLAALPLVGEGRAYTQLDIPIIGPVQKMPSGGFIYMDGRQLWGDLRGGLLQLTLDQYKSVRQWAKNPVAEERKLILAVGDILPLLFAWLSGVDYAFVGTAKSDYYLRDENGWLSRTSGLERWFGSVYLPWERWLMSRSRCRAVFPRDSLTTEILQARSIRAIDLGNPMMDGIVSAEPTPTFFDRHCQEKEKHRQMLALLLPGSRMPEAAENWQKILTAVAEIIKVFYPQKILFLGAIAPALALEPLEKILINGGWTQTKLESARSPISDPDALAYSQNNATLILTQNAYRDCLTRADLAIAMAGTATEQFVGLGKPVFTFPGNGPQFTYAFAEAQTRLLGSSVILVDRPERVAGEIKALLQDSDRIQLIATNGRRRMGVAGAAERIANTILDFGF